jgi:hypothetical protein
LDDFRFRVKVDVLEMLDLGNPLVVFEVDHMLRNLW